MGLGEIPGATLTGLRTYIEGSGQEETEVQKPREVARKKSVLGGRSEVEFNEPGDDELWPLKGREISNTRTEKSIMVKRDVSFLSERVCFQSARHHPRIYKLMVFRTHRRVNIYIAAQ